MPTSRYNADKYHLIRVLAKTQTHREVGAQSHGSAFAADRQTAEGMILFGGRLFNLEGGEGTDREPAFDKGIV
jgi:hypothetical protein